MIALHLRLFAAVLLPLGEASPASAPAAAPAKGRVEITYLANEGFLVATPRIKIVVDGFLKVPYKGYEALTEPACKALLAGSAPFDGQVLGLVSHVHRDHFQGRIGAKFLAANRQAAVLGAPDVVQSLLETAKPPGSIQNQVRPVELGDELHQSVDLAPIDGKILFMQVPHAGGNDVTNYVHLIRLGDVDVLHLGDAEAKRELFEPLELERYDIDVAMVPSWFFASEEGTKIIDELIRPAISVACHIPETDQALFAERMGQQNPHVVVFGARMETRRYVAAEGDAPARLEPVD